MSSNNICPPVTNTNDENSNALVTSGCKSSECHCEGSGVVTTHTTSPNVTQKCYITSSGCHEAVVTTTTQEIRRHKCPPKIKKIHEHVSQPTSYNCTPQLGNIPSNMMLSSCQCNISRSSCCRTNCCTCNNGSLHAYCNRYKSNGCCCSCCCCSTSTVQTTLYPVYMSLPYNQGGSINVPYTAYSAPFNSAYNYPENQYYQY